MFARSSPPGGHLIPRDSFLRQPEATSRGCAHTGPGMPSQLDGENMQRPMPGFHTPCMHGPAEGGVVIHSPALRGLWSCERSERLCSCTYTAARSQDFVHSFLVPGMHRITLMIFDI